MPLTDLTRRSVLVAAPALVAAKAAPRPTDLDGLVATQMKAGGLPGLSAAVARYGRTIYATAQGLADLASQRPVTSETMFHIASITKTVTATAVLQLAQQGRLQLDASVAPHLDFPLAHPRLPDQPITFRQLLNHTSGISDAHYYEVDFRRRGADVDQPLGDFLRQYLARGGQHYSTDGSFGAAPGAAWDYSNVGYGLLGYLAGRIGGVDMREASRRSIFAPLGMTRTSWTLAGTPQALLATPYDVDGERLVPVEPVGFPDWPAGMIRASATDLIRFVGAAADRGGPVLGPAFQAQMLAMARPPSLPAWLTGQGLGWQESALNGVPRPNHWGGDPGVFTAAYLDPRNRSAVVVLTNTTATDAAKAAVKTIAARLLAFAEAV